MAENRMAPGPISGSQNFKEAVCIDANRVYDSCKDKDCLEDLRVYLTCYGQSIADRAINIRGKSAEIIWVYIDVEPVPFNKGFYTVDIKFFIKVKFDAFLGVGRPTEIEGLCTWDKKVILYGSEGNAKIFSSQVKLDGQDRQLMSKTNMPKATVEVVDPIVLDAKIVEPCDKHCCCECDISSIPNDVSANFNDNLVEGDNGNRVLVTLGIFSVVRLERNVQLLVPAYDFCIPEKECVGSSGENPCNLFRKIKFPTDEFFPPAAAGRDRDDRKDNDCGCK